MIAVTSETKLCNQCGEPKPVHLFRLRRRNGSLRQNQCNTCHAAQARCWRARKKIEREDAEIAGFVRDIKNAKSYRNVELLCAGMIARFGGLEELHRTWVRQIEAAQARRPGSKIACDFFLAIFKLLEYLDAQNPSRGEQGEYDLLSDEDLERRIDSYVEEFINEQPELAVAAAARLGWTVVPPQST